MAEKRSRRTGRRNVNGEGTIYRRQDGRYEGKAFVPTPNGGRKRVSVYAPTWDECHAKIVELQDQMRRGVPVATTTETVAEYMTYWLREVAEPSVRRTTFSSYELLTRLYVIPGLGKRKLRSLQASHVRQWLNEVAKTCQCCAQGKDAARAARPCGQARCCAKGECCNQTVSTGTLRYLLRLLRAALQSAVDEDRLSRNVGRLVKVPTGAIRKIHPWSANEATKFLAAARADRLFALWAVALSVGLRRGEALGLRWSDVDLDAGLFHVRVALHRIDGELRLDQVKTDASEDTVPIPAQLRPVLRRHRAQQAAEQLAAGERWQEHGLVFTTKHGTPLEPRNINRRFDQLCDAAEVRRIRVHDLRHSCATLLFTMGVDAATVQRVLRHSSITVTTGTYVEVINEVQQEAVDRLSGLFGDEEQAGT